MGGKLSFNGLRNGRSKTLNRQRSSISHSGSKKQKGKESNKPFLTEDEKVWIINGWRRLEKLGYAYIDDIVGEAWIQAALHSPGNVWAQVGIKCDSDLKSLKQEHRFTKIIYEVRRFLQRQIVEVQLDTGRIRQECYELGARHTHYFHHAGLAYWDSFNLSLTDGIERSLNQFDVCDADNPESMNHENIMKEMYAWQKFIGLVVEEMRSGYLKHYEGEIIGDEDSDLGPIIHSTNCQCKHVSQ